MIKRKRKSSAMTKNDGAQLEKRLLKHMDDRYQQTLRHIDVKNEQLVHDFVGIFGDRTSQHDDQLKDHAKRIARVEDHLGIAA
ncbi:MAG: hypothetical protein PHZ00_02755 [Candidatus Peribacteraceae bacterium]|nr:hypothetical protein [Candidatus Peribacteraceae bacterium]